MKKIKPAAVILAFVSILLGLIMLLPVVWSLFVTFQVTKCRIETHDIQVIVRQLAPYQTPVYKTYINCSGLLPRLEPCWGWPTADNASLK